MYRAICIKKRDDSGRSIDNRNGKKLGEREREINRYVVRRINNLWTVGNNGRELMVGNWRGEGKGD